MCKTEIQDKKLLEIERSLYPPEVFLNEERFLHLFDLLEKKEKEKEELK